MINKECTIVFKDYDDRVTQTLESGGFSGTEILGMLTRLINRIVNDSEEGQPNGD